MLFVWLVPYKTCFSWDTWLFIIYLLNLISRLGFIYWEKSFEDLYDLLFGDSEDLILFSE